MVRLKSSAPWLLSFGVGFLSLSQEMLWVRIASFWTQGLPQGFAFVLACFLLGIALGAHLGKRICQGRADLWLAASGALAVAAVCDLSCLGLLSAAATTVLTPFEALALPVMLSAALKSIVFPIAHHLGSSDSQERLGRSVSHVYFGNILGSTLGPLALTYFLLDAIGTERSMLAVGLGSAVLAGFALMQSARKPALAMLAGGAAIGVAAGFAPETSLLRSVASGLDSDRVVIGQWVEVRQGIVHTVRRKDGAGAEIVYGGNAYDGQAVVDMVHDSNGLARELVMLAAHPRPRRALMVGLSSGAWLRLLTASPTLERIDVVEINPAYTDMVRSHPDLGKALADPRVHLHIDDGRRWLKRNPDARFDLIVQNTTLHWRANVSNLLSVQYLQLCKSHLEPGGIIGLNTTESMDAYATVASVFGRAWRYNSFAYGTQVPLNERRRGAEDRLLALRLEGAPLFTPDTLSRGAAGKVLTGWFRPETHPGGQVITDDNLLNEFFHGGWQGELQAMLSQWRPAAAGSPSAR